MKLGDVVRDRETGFSGVLEARWRYFDDFGELWLVQPQRSRKGRRVKAKWFFPWDLEVLVSLPARPRRGDETRRGTREAV